MVLYVRACVLHNHSSNHQECKQITVAPGRSIGSNISLTFQNTTSMAALPFPCN